jgi:hypothetical protein
VSEQIVHIIRRKDDKIVEANLLDGVKPEDLLLVERSWTTKRQEIMQQLLTASVPREQWPESLHWDWSMKAQELKLLSTFGWTLQCEGEFQGVMLVETASHFADLEQDRGKPLVYIDYLETAPWNWNYAELSQKGTYRGIGQVLFQTAIQHSQKEGFHGRVGLHSLPQAEGFYEKACGMTRFGKDPDKQNLVYFELSRTAGTQRLFWGEEQ